MDFGLPSLASSTSRIITRQKMQWIFCCLHGPSDYLAWGHWHELFNWNNWNVSCGKFINEFFYSLNNVISID
jgi:hypothetical protein